MTPAESGSAPYRPRHALPTRGSVRYLPVEPVEQDPERPAPPHLMRSIAVDVASYAGVAAAADLHSVAVRHTAERDRIGATASRSDRITLADEPHSSSTCPARYAGARQTVLEGGDHSFTRWDAYLDPILRFAGLLPA